MPPRQGLGQRQHLPTARRGITRQALQRQRPCWAQQRLAQLVHRRVVQRVFEADQVVVLLDQRDEVEAKLQRRRLDARPHIGQATGQRRRHGQMALFRRVKVAWHAAGVDGPFGQQVVHQQAGARAGLAVQEPQLAGRCGCSAGCRHGCGRACKRREVRQALQAPRVAGPHHQALGAAQAADQLVLAGFEQWLQSRCKLARPTLQRRHMQACNQAAALCQCGQCVRAAGKTQLDVQPVLLAGQVLQQRQPQVMAGHHGEHMLAAVQRLGQHPLQLGTQRLDVRCQPGACAFFSPQQAVGKRCQPGRLALDPGDQRLTQHVLPALELAPDVAVTGAQRLGRVLDRAVRMHRAEQVKQRVVQRSATLAIGLETVLQVNAAGFHRRKPCSLSRILCRLGHWAPAASMSH